MFRIVFGYCIDITFVDAVRLFCWDLFYGNMNICVDAKPGALFGHVLMTLKSSGLSCKGNQSELRTFECMSAFEVIQECEHLNASGSYA